MLRSLTLCALVALFACGDSSSEHGGWQAVSQPLEKSLGDRGREAFDLRAVVSGASEFRLRGSAVEWRRLEGETPRDDGSALTAPLPGRTPEDLEITQIAGRGRLEIMERPSAANGWSVVFRIDDPAAGEDEYHIRLGWKSDESALMAAVSPILLERCHREVQVLFQERYPHAAFAWDSPRIRPAGVLSYLNGEATAAQDDRRMRVGWECFVDPRRNAVREADFELLDGETP